MTKSSAEATEWTTGVDLGDRWSEVCELETSSGAVVRRCRVRTREEDLRRSLGTGPRRRVVLETGAHSPWVSRLLGTLGHEVVVAHASRVALIGASRRKTDRVDAEVLARLGRVDPQLLAPVEHRAAEVQTDRAVLRGRDALVRARTLLINTVRGTVKSAGGRLPSCSAERFAVRAAEAIPEPLRPALLPLLDIVGEITQRIHALDQQVEALCAHRYPATAQLRQVSGVGAVTALAYVLTVEDPARFPHHRTVGAYFGLVPARRSSGQMDPQLRISKQGDGFVRRLLVSSAHYILGPFGPDCELRRFGQRLAAAGGKNAKRRAVVAVARKLAVLLHRLWVSGEPYQPLRRATANA
jgi:transposase